MGALPPAADGVGVFHTEGLYGAFRSKPTLLLEAFVQNHVSCSTPEALPAFPLDLRLYIHHTYPSVQFHDTDNLEQYCHKYH